VLTQCAIIINRCLVPLSTAALFIELDLTQESLLDVYLACVARLAAD